MPYERSFDEGRTWQPLDAKTMRTVDRASRIDHDDCLIQLDNGYTVDTQGHGWWRKVRETPKPSKQPAKQPLSLF